MNKMVSIDKRIRHANDLDKLSLRKMLCEVLNREPATISDDEIVSISILIAVKERSESGLISEDF